MQLDQMRRREFIALLGGAAAVWPLAAGAQQTAKPVVGFLQPGSPADSGHHADAFVKGLKESGFTEGENVSIEYRWAEGRYDRLPQHAEELVKLRVAVIAAGSPPATVAAKASTSTIPIVFITLMIQLRTALSQVSTDPAAI
jgi:putative ABC transport system substrate-binding protein